LIADKDSGLLQPLARTPGETTSVEFNLIDLNESAVAALVRSKKPLALERLDPAEGSGLIGLAGGDPAALAVPMCVQDRLSGLLLVGGKEDHEKFRAEEVEFLDFLSQHVATVLENAKLFESATFDGLTGILRREALLDRLLQEVRRALRYRRPLTVGMADLDHFKAVNDTHGHLAGDATLKRVAANLASTLRGADFVGRYGGEEFLLVFPETEPASALEVAQRIRRLVESQAVPSPSGQAVTVTISIGLAELDFAREDENQAVTELIRQADLALYQAKGTGRNQVRLAGSAAARPG